MNSYPHTLIRASAGTGKTFQLSNRYLGLMQAGAMPDQILATTFTRKAAGEILDRVVVRLADAALNEPARRELAKWLSSPSLSQDRCHQLLQALIRQLHRLKICTLDSFFAQLAGSFSLELGLPPNWRIIEQLHDSYLRSEAIEMTLKSDSNREVQRLVHLMTKGEAHRAVSELVRTTVDDLYDLYMETDAGAWRRIPRPPMLSGQQLADAFESLRNAQLPNDKRFREACDKDLQLAEIGDWEEYVERGLVAKVLDGETHYYRKEIPREVVAIYSQLIQHARAVLLTQMAQQTEATHELLDRFHKIYGRLKRQARSLRFEDITRSLAGGDGLGSLDRQQFRLDSAIDQVLLDEFQDTSLPQWHVLRPFARSVTSPSPRRSLPPHSPRPSLFCVGDVKQAIYGWRGGRSEIFDALESELANLTHDSLNESFRSAQPIIDTVNRVFTGMTRHPNLDKYGEAVAAWCGQFQPHTTRKAALAGYAELCTAPAADETSDQESTTLAFAADRIAELLERAAGHGIGVLVRRNKIVAQLIYELRARRVPASEEGGNPLTDSPAVQVILSLLKMADHPGDTVARFHVAQSPLAPHVGYANGADNERALLLAREVRSDLLHHGYGSMAGRWTRMLQPSCSRRDRSRLEQLVDLACRYDQFATLRTSDFIRFVEGERVADPTTAAVRVMTVHQAKGLQFDIVVLPDLDAKLIGQTETCVVGQPAPTERVDRVCLYRNTSIQRLLPEELQELFREGTRRSVNEALCVLYVALTRAIHALHVIIAPSAANERSLHKTSAGLLRAALTDGQPLGAAETVFQTGDARWYQQGEPRQAVSRGRAARATLPKISLAPMPAGSRPEHAAPSKLEGGARVPAAHVLNLESSVATTRGTLMHALFEQIVWLDDGPPDAATLRRAVQPLAGTELDLDQQLSDFHAMLETPEVASVLCRSFYQPPGDPRLRDVIPKQALSGLQVEVHNERRFVVRDEHRILSGAIDRLVLIRVADQLVAADIVDFKTDAVSREDPRGLDERVEHYRPQIDAYRRAVARMYRLPADRIAARLLFVSARVMRAV